MGGKAIRAHEGGKGRSAKGTAGNSRSGQILRPLLQQTHLAVSGSSAVHDPLPHEFKVRPCRLDCFDFASTLTEANNVVRGSLTAPRGTGTGRRTLGMQLLQHSPDFPPARLSIRVCSASAPPTPCAALLPRALSLQSSLSSSVWSNVHAGTRTQTTA